MEKYLGFFFMVHNLYSYSIHKNIRSDLVIISELALRKEMLSTNHWLELGQYELWALLCEVGERH